MRFIKCRNSQRPKHYQSSSPHTTAYLAETVKNVQQQTYPHFEIIIVNDGSFGSTVGVEAAYMRKVSILLSKLFYDRLDVTYFPMEHSETMALLNARLESKPLDNALKFCYYSATFGIPFKHYASEDFGRGKFKGVDLSLAKSPLHWLTNLIYHNS